MNYRSNEDLEKIARLLRRKLGLEDRARLDMMTVIMKLKANFSGFSYVRVPDHEMPNAFARFDSDKQLLEIQESTFQKMQRGESHANMTICHEIGHFALGHKGTRNRSIIKTVGEKAGNRTKFEESEAKRFGAFFMAPEYLAGDAIDENSLIQRFGLSPTAAKYRSEEIEDLRRRASKVDRKLPSFVKEFLREAKSKGIVIKTEFDDEDGSEGDT